MLDSRGELRPDIFDMSFECLLLTLCLVFTGFFFQVYTLFIPRGITTYHNGPRRLPSVHACTAYL